MTTRDSGYAQLTARECETFAVKVQRAWHFDNYPPAEQAAILARVRRLVASNPNSYLARVWRQVYSEQP